MAALLAPGFRVDIFSSKFIYTLDGLSESGASRSLRSSLGFGAFTEQVLTFKTPHFRL